MHGAPKDDLPEETLPGGNVGGAVRIGDTVRRHTGPWTEAVHRLLNHLESAGFEAAPLALGIDPGGREILTYIEGDTVGDEIPWPDWVWTEQTLVQAVLLLRRYHDLVEGFRPTAPVQWRFGRACVGPGEVVCHNDVAPYNVVHRGGRLVGVIDWDLAAPGRREWDLAFTAWQFVPLHHPGLSRKLGWKDRSSLADRLRLLCDVYGLESRSGFVDLITARIEASINGIASLADAGDKGFVRLIEQGHVAGMVATLSYLASMKDTLEVAVA